MTAPHRYIRTAYRGRAPGGYRRPEIQAGGVCRRPGGHRAWAPTTSAWIARRPTLDDPMCRTVASLLWRCRVEGRRDGATPWAIEMKVAGSACVGQYYRHALLRPCSPASSSSEPRPALWFDAKNLTASDCKGAGVVPNLTAQTRRRDGLEGRRRVFEIDLIEVDPASAWLR